MSKKVLVVDDDPDVRLFSVTVLEENGYTALEAEDGDQPLKIYVPTTVAIWLNKAATRCSASRSANRPCASIRW